MIDTGLLSAMVAAMALGGFVQGALGFGCGTVAVPIMVMAGIHLPEAVTIVYLGVIFQCTHGWSRHRHLVQWRETFVIFLLRLVGLPVGVTLMATLMETGRRPVQQTVGGVMLVALALQWIRVEPRTRVPWPWTITAGTTSGLLAGLMGVGAAPLVLWTNAHAWTGDRIRTFLWMTFLQVTPLHILILYFKFGTRITDNFLPGLACAPVCVGGAILGGAVGQRMSLRVLRSVSYGIILLIALACLLSFGT